MSIDYRFDTNKIFDLLVNGREAQRDAVLEVLYEYPQDIDRARLRILILDALSREFYPNRENQENDRGLVWVRSWLLSALTIVKDNDTDATNVIKRHLDPNYETADWVRYWVLSQLVETKTPDLEKLANDILAREKVPLVRMLAVAILASNGDSRSLKEIQDGLLNTELRWATLRALRIVPILETVNNLCEIVNRVNREALTEDVYDAITALGKIRNAPQRLRSTSQHLENAKMTLTNFIANNRKSPFRDGFRTKAIIALGNLKVENTASILVDELCDDNPVIVRDAARALEKVLGIRSAVIRIIDAASRANVDQKEEFASALRWMNRDPVVEVLQFASTIPAENILMNRDSVVKVLVDVMSSGSLKEQETARYLLSGMGGIEAFQKLLARTKVITQYTSELEKAEEKIRGLFETSIDEARKGFRLLNHMDVSVFLLGIGLIYVSAVFALYKSGSLEGWVGLGLTGGTGVLGVIYGTLIAKPRQQVQDAVDHLMYLKVIFLAYLRQLHQIDQSYTRRLLDDKPLTVQEVENFSKMVSATMGDAVRHLTFIKSRSTDFTASELHSHNSIPELNSENRQPDGNANS